MSACSHSLAALLRRAAQGIFPSADGRTQVISAPPGPADAVVAFTGHHVIAANVVEDEIRAHLRPDDVGAPMETPFLYWLSQRLSVRAGMLDLVLAAFPAPDADIDLIQRTDLAGHPRVRRAMRYRHDLRIYSDLGRHGLLIIGTGLANRVEVSVEVDSAHRNHGLGRRLARAARAIVPRNEPVFAQIATGNVASLRAFLKAGYRPIGSEVLFLSRPA